MLLSVYLIIFLLFIIAMVWESVSKVRMILNPKVFFQKLKKIIASHINYYLMGKYHIFLEKEKINLI